MKKKRETDRDSESEIAHSGDEQDRGSDPLQHAGEV